MLKELRNRVESLGKEEWRLMLFHAAELHENGIHPPFFKLPYQWEEVYSVDGCGFIFGSWESVHIALDTVAIEPKHAIYQIMSILALQREDGSIPGSIILENGQIRSCHYTTSPPLWPTVAHEYLEITSCANYLKQWYEILEKQIGWFEKQRYSGRGFYYVDCLDRLWESGIEEGARCDCLMDSDEEIVCVDATAHVYGLYMYAIIWGRMLGREVGKWQSKAESLRAFIQSELFDEETGFFHDIWTIADPERRIMAFEGIWPLVLGAASAEQAHRMINENLIEPTRFFSKHPIPSIGLNDSRFEYRHWRGPVRNSMTYWAARGCLRYGRPDAACQLLEKALDATAEHFQSTGSLWEFYHPQGTDSRSLSSHSAAGDVFPKANYLGHNPLIAMTRLWEFAVKSCI